MVGFIVYDLTFLVIFTLAVFVFLYTRKHNLKREGLLYLYRTKVGLKFIEWASNKFSKSLYYLQYLIIVSGYALMASMVYLLIKFSYFYLTSPVAARALKVPVIIPLIPYLPELFKIDFLPPFFFTYWIIIIAIIAVPHEFAHGIFARLNKIKIHSTGFGFLGPFLAAFVEQDEKQMEKAKKFPQLAVLAAGTFANVVFTIIFVLILWFFFSSTFVPAGVNYMNVYPASQIRIADITSINGMPLENQDQIFSLSNLDLVEINANNKNYFANVSILKATISNNLAEVIVYDNTPAFNARIAGGLETGAISARIQGAVTEFDGIKILSAADLQAQLNKHSSGDKVVIKTIQKSSKLTNSLSNLYLGEEKEFNLKLADKNGKAFIGLYLVPELQQQGSLISKFYSFISKIKNPTIYYTSYLGGFGIFIYDLLWWIVVISISVALVNMLPLGIFDGGRFFYLTIWGITGSKAIGEKAFKWSTRLLLLLVLVLLLKWVFVFI